MGEVVCEMISSATEGDAVEEDIFCEMAAEEVLEKGCCEKCGQLLQGGVNNDGWDSRRRYGRRCNVGRR